MVDSINPFYNSNRHDSVTYALSPLSMGKVMMYTLIETILISKEYCQSGGTFLLFSGTPTEPSLTEPRFSHLSFSHQITT
jgi:hypothetical protein